MDKIYTLELHESITTGDFRITRVAGGWLYETIVNDGIAITFVPFNNEFMKKDTTDAH